MNRNFLTAFCIVALVGLSCPIVAKMACPVDEYFNQELQLVTSPSSESSDPKLTIVSGLGELVNYNSYGDYITYLCTDYDKYIPNVNMSRYVYCQFQILNASSSNDFNALGWNSFGSVMNFKFNFTLRVPPSYGHILIRAHVWDDFGFNAYSTCVPVYQTSVKSFSSDLVIYIDDEKYVFENFSEKSEVINYEKSEYIESDEPKRKEEDIEESETEFPEVPEITE